MQTNQFFNVLNFHENHCKLKDMERTGWKKWNVSGRLESVADHTSSAQALAWALWSEYELDLDIFKVIAMLSIHEEGETIIGDITPYDVQSVYTKSEREKAAIDNICKPLKKGKIIVSLFDEFEAKETPEAKFAYLCDKLDCDLQAKAYSNSQRCNIANATYEIVSKDEIQEIIKNGAETVWEVFYQADKHIYEDTFLKEFFSALMAL